MLVWGAIAKRLEASGAAALVTVLDSKGSAPRDAGARMVVFEDGGFTGTIGGGTLEWRAVAMAQARLAGAGPDRGAVRLVPFALGPELGQCCGGHVTLALETFGPADHAEVADLAAREAAGRFATKRTLATGGRREIVEPADTASARLVDGVITEWFGEDRRTLMLFGAGHVGRALVLALAPLPFRVVWIDPRPAAFPKAVPPHTSLIRPPDPVATLAEAPDGAFVLVMTHSHALDLEIVDAALRAARFPYVGVIGSATKRARFAKRLTEMGHDDRSVGRLVCPIGATGPRSKLPAVIAAATTVELIVADEAARAASRDRSAPTASNGTGQRRAVGGRER